MHIQICSREKLEQLMEKKQLQNAAVISFHDVSEPSEDWISLQCNEQIKMFFRIAADDIDADELEECGLSYDTYFKEADELVPFIYEARESGCEIICQCDHGQGRSAGCAAAILEHFDKNGISVFRDYNYYPNKLVFNKLYEALEKGGRD